MRKIIDFNNKFQELKKRIQEVFELLNNNYDIEKTALSNKFIFLKKNLDKVKRASVHLSKLNFIYFNNTKDLNNLGDEVKELHAKTLQNITKIEALLNQQYKNTNLEQYNKEVIYHNNLDNLKLAKNYLKYIDPYFEEEALDIGNKKVSKEVS